MSVIITGSLSHDAEGKDRVQLPAGPFNDREAGQDWLNALGPLNGSWNFEELHQPADALIVRYRLRIEPGELPR